jgi:hypothetical protein
MDEWRTSAQAARLVARSAHPQRHRRPRAGASARPPVPVVARIVWEEDGEEYLETVAAGWSGRLVYVRMPDRRYRLKSVWLDAADVTRR